MDAHATVDGDDIHLVDVVLVTAVKASDGHDTATGDWSLLIHP